MTEQIPEKLLNKCNEADFSHLELYGVLVGDISKPHSCDNYKFKTQQPTDYLILSCCWRGCVSKYKITKDKELFLIGFEAPCHDSTVVKANELATGDFWLDMRSDYCHSVYVPFRSGRLICDREEWLGFQDTKWRI